MKHDLRYEAYASSLKKMLRDGRKCFMTKKMFHRSSWPSAVMICGGVFKSEALFSTRSNASLDETMLRFCTSCKNEARDGFVICSIYH